MGRVKRRPRRPAHPARLESASTAKATTSERFSNLRGVLRHLGSHLVVRMKQRSERFASLPCLMSLVYAAPIFKVEDEDIRDICGRAARLEQGGGKQGK